MREDVKENLLPVEEIKASADPAPEATPREELEPAPTEELSAFGADDTARVEGETPALVAIPSAGVELKPTPKHAWYVVHCYSGYENKVKKGLEQRIVSMGMQERIFRVVVPVDKEVEIKEGQKRVVPRRVFPGYILVEMAELQEGDRASDETWYIVRNTPGVTGFVSSGDKPTALREEEVQRILKRMETAEPTVRVTFKPGQVVQIIEGPFADFRGTVDEISMEKGKVRVMVSFFGRETPVELDLTQVEKV
jgi:transcriptional antiterminator NusG